MQESILLFFKNISSPALDVVAELVTMLGEQYFFIVVISFLFWNISKRSGLKLSAAFIYSALLNAVLKIGFHSPRPFEKLDFIEGKRVHTATGYSFPSGHTQGSTTFFVALAQIIKKNWFTFCAVIFLLLVGVSRIYLGVHWPIDVIVAIILGIIMSLVICKIVDKYYDDQYILRIIFFRMQFVVIIITIALFIVDLLILKGSMKIHDFFKISGISTGAVYGFFLEGRYINFCTDEVVWIKKLLRFLFGLFGTVVILIGLKLLLPEHDLLNFCRYSVIGLWTTFFWPAIGSKLKLFKTKKRSSL